MMTGSANALKWFDTFLFATPRTKTLMALLAIRLSQQAGKSLVITTNGSIVYQRFCCALRHPKSHYPFVPSAAHSAVYRGIIPKLRYTNQTP